MIYSLISLASLVLAKSNNLFDIVYINLESRKDRREHVENMLNYADCSYTRFNAVNGIDLLSGKKKLSDYTDSNRFDEDLPKYKQLDSNLFGMSGCKLSHQIIWDGIAKKKTARPTLIIEDDLELSADFVEKLNNAIKNEPEDWDLFLLSNYVHWKKDATVDKKTNLVKVGFFFECLAYVVRDSLAAEKMVRESRTFGIDFPIDLCIGNVSNWGKLNAYAFSPFLAVQRRDEFGTNITSSGEIGLPPRMGNSLMTAYKRKLAAQ